MAERYDKVHRNIIKIDNKLIVDLFNVVGTMNINEIKQFTMIEQIPYNVIDVNGNTLIHRVLLENNILKTENQRLQVIKYLYNENVNPDAPNNMNYTPLHIACIKQYEYIIKYLRDIRVYINYKDKFDTKIIP
jgi:ankyrin repeat protein